MTLATRLYLAIAHGRAAVAHADLVWAAGNRPCDANLIARKRQAADDAEHAVIAARHRAEFARLRAITYPRLLRPRAAQA